MIRENFFWADRCPNLALVIIGWQDWWLSVSFASEKDLAKSTTSKGTMLWES